jgi:hypothetical protein
VVERGDFAIDQLVLTLAQDVFSEASDLALAHKLALVLRGAADDHRGLAPAGVDG